jgi:hypothetical protein
LQRTRVEIANGCFSSSMVRAFHLARLTKIAKQPSARKGVGAIAAPVWPPRRGSLPTDRENFNDPSCGPPWLSAAISLSFPVIAGATFATGKAHRLITKLLGFGGVYHVASAKRAAAEAAAVVIGQETGAAGGSRMIAFAICRPNVHPVRSLSRNPGLRPGTGCVIGLSYPQRICRYLLWTRTRPGDRPEKVSAETFARHTRTRRDSGLGCSSLRPLSGVSAS